MLPAPPPPPPRPWARPLLLVAVVVGTAVAVQASGVAEGVTLDTLQATVRDAGPAAIPAYWALFVVGVALTIPGNLFVLLGLVVFGPVQGAPLALVGACIAGTVVTRLYQAIGGRAEAPRLRIAQRGLELLDKRPVLGILLIRLALQLSAPANLLLALAGVKARDNAIGTVLGNVPITLLGALAVDLVVDWLAT